LCFAIADGATGVPRPSHKDLSRKLIWSFPHGSGDLGNSINSSIAVSHAYGTLLYMTSTVVDLGHVLINLMLVFFDD